MLLPQPTYLPADERDEEIFQATVPQDHYLRRVKQVIDFERLRPIVADSYCNDQGRPAIVPLLLLKLEFLEYQYNLSDRQVIEQARCHMAFRYFLDLPGGGNEAEGSCAPWAYKRDNRPPPSRSGINWTSPAVCNDDQQARFSLLS